MLSTGMVLVYPLLHERVPFLKDNLKTYSFWPFSVDTVAQDTVTTDTLVEVPPPPPQDTVPVELFDDSGNYTGVGYLNPFFKMLSEMKTQPQQVRIGHFGDSSIEGDLITMSLRDSLQRQYGGNGVGFVPILDIHPGFRVTVRHAFSNNWNPCYVLDKNNKPLKRGISSEYFTAVSGKDSTELQNCYVEYQPTKNYYGTSIFSSARLFYGHSSPDSAKTPPNSLFWRADTVQKSAILTDTSWVNVLQLTDFPTKNIKLSFSIRPKLPIYGVSFESKEGIIVDNFSARGSSGTTLADIPVFMWQGFQAKLGYDLLILQFGVNAFSEKSAGYKWFEKLLDRTLQHLRQALPDCPILLVGVPDRAVKDGNFMRTPPGIKSLNTAIRNAAALNRCAYFDLYAAMGGAGSMLKWVDDIHPPLANKDYTHFNARGGRRVSDLLIRFLSEGMKEYQQQLNKNEKTVQK